MKNHNFHRCRYMDELQEFTKTVYFSVKIEFNCFQVLISRDRPLVASYHLTILPSHGQKCHRSHLTILPSYHLTARSTAGLQLPILPSYHLTKISMCFSHLTILPTYHQTKPSEWALHLTILPSYGADAKYTKTNPKQTNRNTP